MTKATEAGSAADLLFAKAEPEFAQWEVVKDLVDECIDLMLNYRQSGHPGGSRSKVHALLSTMLSGAMRFDLMKPWRPYGDRFVLSHFSGARPLRLEVVPQTDGTLTLYIQRLLYQRRKRHHAQEMA